jgi:hypothetical protein
MTLSLPRSPAPYNAVPSLLNFGLKLRPATGGKVLKIERPGSRYRADISYRPMEADQARVFISRLLEIERSGNLLLPYPLAGVSQGSPGAPVIDGANQAGTTLTLRACRPNYRFKEGYWLSLVTAGQHYLYNCRSNAIASPEGEVALAIEPPLRKPPADGDKVLVAEPMIEGFLDGVFSWPIDDGLLVSIGFTIEEAA